MRRLLISTTALSVALGSVNPWPMMAQTVAEDGSIIGEDGSILCLQTEENICDIEDFIGTAADDAAAAEAAAAEAEAEAAAQAAEEAAAAEAEAQAEAEQRAAEEAAAAEAEAQAEAEQRAAEEAAAAEAAAQAEAEQQAADEAAAAEAAAQAAAEQQAADEEAAAQAEAEQQAAEEAAAQAEAEAAERAAAERAAAEQQAADEAAADEAAAEAEAAAQEQESEPAEDVVTEDPSATDPALDEALDTLLSEEAPADEAVSDEAVADDLAADAPVGDAVAEVIEVPEPTEETVETLTNLMANPDEEDPAELGAAAALAALPALVEGEPLDMTPAEDAQVTVQTVTEETARSSSEEFATRAAEGDTRTETQRTTSTRQRASRNDNDGLSDLEKAGLVALGALVVGSLISANRDRVVANTGDRVVVERGTGDYVVYKDDDTLLRRPGSTVRTETFRDGSTRTIVERPDGTQVVTIRDATGRVLRRATYDGQGRELILFDDLVPEERIDVSTLPRPVGRVISISGSEQDALLKARMAALDAEELGRSFSLRQIRDLREVRQLAATIDVNNITFDSGSSAIKATEAEELAALGRFITSMIRENPREMFLIEGHTDAVGSAASNLALSDRRAESVALALTEYFNVPPENLIVQGYGESELRVNTQASERQNRRVAVRIVTPLLRNAALR